jgi:uncharacterized protein YdaU (DUF1376 family)
MKIRRFDLYPDDAIAGMIELTNEERGVLAMAIFAIYSHGGPITRDHLRRLCPGHARTHQRIESRLLELNKLCVTDDGKLSQKRCEKEIKNARNRLETSQENGRRGGRTPSRNNDVAKPTGSPRARTREGVTKTTTFFKKEKGENEVLGREAPSDAVAVIELVAEAKRVLNGRTIRDRQAYDAAVANSVYSGWLKRMSNYVMSDFNATTSTPRLEAIDEAFKAGSREATPPAVRKILNQIDAEMRRRKCLGRGAA